jgi:hypothetical protein
MRKYFILSLMAGAGVVVACTGDGVAVTPTQDATTSDGTVQNDGSTNNDATTEDDSGLVELDGGTIEDAGGDPETDGGVLVDAGADAGPCGPPAGNTSVTSTCSSTKLLYTGGTIIAGTYDLIGFTVTGTVTYCGLYIPQSWSGKLVVTAVKGGFRFDERAFGKGITNGDRSYIVSTTTTTPLTSTQQCGVAINDASWAYSSGKISTDAGTKTALAYQHNLGTASVRYRWAKQ